jgi:hypothetical protein
MDERQPQMTASPGVTGWPTITATLPTITMG